MYILGTKWQHAIYGPTTIRISQPLNDVIFKLLENEFRLNSTQKLTQKLIQEVIVVLHLYILTYFFIFNHVRLRFLLIHPSRPPLLELGA